MKNDFVSKEIIIEGQIIGVYDDVLKIRSKDGKIFSFSFMKVKEYITE